MVFPFRTRNIAVDIGSYLYNTRIHCYYYYDDLHIDDTVISVGSDVLYICGITFHTLHTPGNIPISLTRIPHMRFTRIQYVPKYDMISLCDISYIYT